MQNDDPKASRTLWRLWATCSRQLVGTENRTCSVFCSCQKLVEIPVANQSSSWVANQSSRGQSLKVATVCGGLYTKNFLDIDLPSPSSSQWPRVQRFKTGTLPHHSLFSATKPEIASWVAGHVMELLVLPWQRIARSLHWMLVGGANPVANPITYHRRTLPSHL